MDPLVTNPTAKTTSHQYVRWCFTVNNPKLGKQAYLDALVAHCKYIIIGSETCPTTGTPHFQGYLELNKRLRFSQVVALFPKDSPPHLESAKGSKKTNHRYCSKEGDFLEHGEPVSCGKRSDLDALVQLAADQVPMREVAESDKATFVRNYRGLGVLQALYFQPRVFRSTLEVELYYGKTGTGKTYKAFTENEDLYKKPVGKGLWFDGFDPRRSKTVLLDEYVGQYPLDAMLMLLDIYPVQVEVKGGHVYLDVDKIIVATNSHPSGFYENWHNREAQYAAFCRRFTRVFFFKERDNVELIDTSDKLDHFWQHPEQYAW